MTLVKNLGAKQPIGLGMQSTSCGVGILVTEIDPGSSASQSELKLGDCILSINNQVPSNPKEAVSLILKSEREVKFIIIGDAQATFKGGLPVRG